MGEEQTIRSSACSGVHDLLALHDFLLLQAMLCQSLTCSLRYTSCWRPVSGAATSGHERFVRPMIWCSRYVSKPPGFSVWSRLRPSGSWMQLLGPESSKLAPRSVLKEAPCATTPSRTKYIRVWSWVGQTPSSGRITTHGPL